MIQQSVIRNWLRCVIEHCKNLNESVLYAFSDFELAELNALNEFQNVEEGSGDLFHFYNDNKKWIKSSQPPVDSKLLQTIKTLLHAIASSVDVEEAAKCADKLKTFSSKFSIEHYWTYFEIQWMKKVGLSRIINRNPLNSGTNRNESFHRDLKSVFANILGTERLDSFLDKFVNHYVALRMSHQKNPDLLINERNQNKSKYQKQNNEYQMENFDNLVNLDIAEKPIEKPIEKSQ